ncbi:MAG: MFS transporter [Acidobacteriia bacterium]|nr:MFS transporter [Terriglobia bacterium]
MKKAFTPLRHGLFRAMWIASVVSNVGTWMHTVAASWLMTLLAASPLMVALVQTATTLPVFLITLPAGAIADLIDRRRWLIFTQSVMLAVAAVIGVLTLMGRMGPWMLLLLTFALGIGSSLNQPAWSATIPELVPREELPAAVALNSVGFNIARAIGPALGGMVMAASNAGVVFILNAMSFLAVIIVLCLWNGSARRNASARMREAIREGLSYVRSTRVYHAVLVRAGLFAFAASALWALLPVVASTQLGTTETGYGILLGCLGAGSVVGAAMLGALRARYSPDRLIAAGAIAFALATVALAAIHSFLLVAAAMVIGGVAWMTVMTTFNVSAQTAPPAELRARALAVYILVFQGALAIGSAIWGAVAGRWHVNNALLIAAVAIAAGLITGAKLPLENAAVEDTEYVA